MNKVIVDSTVANRMSDNLSSYMEKIYRRDLFRKE